MSLIASQNDRKLQIFACCSKNTGDGIRTGAEADAYIRSLKFSGMTALGTAIEERVILPFVVQRAQNHTLSKPVLVSTLPPAVQIIYLSSSWCQSTQLAAFIQV